MSAPRQGGLRRLLPVMVIALVVAGYMLTGYLTLDEAQRRVPMLTGYVTLLLLALEAFRSRHRGAGASPAAPVKPGVPVSREVTALLYLGGLVLGIYFVGYLVAIPLFLFAALFWLGRQPAKSAGVITVVASIAIYLVFELTLEYRLFQGILLD